jgi:hypothetical protein
LVAFAVGPWLAFIVFGAFATFGAEAGFTVLGADTGFVALTGETAFMPFGCAGFGAATAWGDAGRDGLGVPPCP